MIAVAALVASTAVWMALEARVSAREPHAHLPRELATGLLLLAVHVTAIAVPGPARMFGLGLALIAAGVALRVSSIHALGPAFVSTTSAPVRLVRAGPYRWMRHPSELGLLAAAVGAAVLMTSVAAAGVIILGLAPLILVRCAAEDRTISRWAR
ncbi:MAG: phosphatidylethanolamine N-methyltransferase family protein [Myxococcota bacterium]|nr:phosphatidylethanolamine N-methyltransferase family protein [Myxococcota bacterium]